METKRNARVSILVVAFGVVIEDCLSGCRDVGFRVFLGYFWNTFLFGRTWGHALGMNPDAKNKKEIHHDDESLVLKFPR